MYMLVLKILLVFHRISELMYEQVINDFTSQMVICLSVVVVHGQTVG